MNYADDATLLYDLHNGKESAYVYLVDTYSKPLFTYALSLSNDHANAQDIIQNVFLKVWKRRAKLQSINSIKGYLYKVTYNEFINQYKQQKALLELEIAYKNSLDKAVTTTETVEKEQVFKMITKEIDKLPPKCKHVFILSKKEGLTNIEIAEHLGISIKTVEGQISKAYRVLRNKLKDKVNHLFFLLLDNSLLFDT